MSQPDALVAALTELTEVMAALSTRLRREAEVRLGQEPLAPAHRAILAGLTANGQATVAELADSLSLTTSVVRAGMAELERRGLASRGPAAERPMHQSYRATELAGRLRELVRDRAGYHFGYALAPMSPTDVSALEQATEALTGLAAALAPPPPRHGGRVAPRPTGGAAGWAPEA